MESQYSPVLVFMQKFAFDRKEVVHRVAAVIVSVAALLLVLEVGYRVVLYHKLQNVSEEPSFNAANTSICEYDEELGYRYIPGARMESLVIRNGSVKVVQKGWVNRDGNIGIHDTPWNDGQFHVLAVGDSFTANPTSEEGPITWTDYFPEALKRVNGRPVAVKNYGRDGYGIPQIFHQAVAQAKRLKPDLILIVFITDDLTRARTWRTTVTVDGIPRVLISSRPGNPPDMRMSADMCVLHPELTADIKSLPEKGRYALQDKLWERYGQIVGDNLKVDLASLTTSFLYHRLADDDPFFDCYKPSRNPRVEYYDYDEDPILVEDIEQLKKIGCPYVVVQIPSHKEMSAKSYLMRSQARNLFMTLERLLGEKILQPLHQYRVPEKFEDYFLLPNDDHPNQAGARLYARMIAAALKDYAERRDWLEANGELDLPMADYD